MSDTSNGQDLAFLDEDSTMYDLNKLTFNLASTGFSGLEVGLGINDSR